jgi:hypothetical protein
LALPGADEHRLAIGLLATATREAFRRGDPLAGRTLADRAIVLAAEPGRVVSPRVWAYAATTRHLLDDFQGMGAVLHEGVAVAKRLGDPFDLAFVAGTAAAILVTDVSTARAYADMALAAIDGVCGPEMRVWVGGLWAMAYFDTDPGRARQRFEEVIHLDAQVGGGGGSAHSFGYLAVLEADAGLAAQALATARRGVLHTRDLGDLMALATTLEYTAVTLSTLEHHETAAVIYAINDADVVAVFRRGTEGWRNALRLRGRSSTLDALGPEAIDRHRARARSMTVPSIVEFTVEELDRILSDLGEAQVQRPDHA